MCVCMHVGTRACMCVCVCVCVLYALNFDNMYMKRICKHLEPVQVRCSKYPLLLLNTGTQLNQCRLDLYNSQLTLDHCLNLATPVTVFLLSSIPLLKPQGSLLGEKVARTAISLHLYKIMTKLVVHSSLVKLFMAAKQPS